MTVESVNETEAEKAREAQALVASGSEDPIDDGQPIAQPDYDIAISETSDDSTTQIFSSFHEDNFLSQSIRQLIDQLFLQIQHDTHTALDQVKKEHQVEQQKLNEELKDAQSAVSDLQTKESDYLAQLEALKSQQEASEKESKKQEKQLEALNSEVQEYQIKIASQDDELRQLKQLLVMRESELSSSTEANTKLLQEISNLRPDYEQLKEQISIVAQVIQSQDDHGSESKPVEPAALLAELTVEIQTLRSELLTKNELLTKFGRGFYEQIKKPEE